MHAVSLNPLHLQQMMNQRLFQCQLPLKSAASSFSKNISTPKSEQTRSNMVKEWGQLLVLQGYLQVKILSYLHRQPRALSPQ